MRDPSGPAEPGRAAPPLWRAGRRRGLGGRAARLRHRLSSFAAGRGSPVSAKRRSRSAPSSALRRRILTDAAALMSARRERSAPAASGLRRMTASSSARLAPAKKSGSPCRALPLGRAQAGTGAPSRDGRTVGSRRPRIFVSVLRAAGRAQEWPRRGRRWGSGMRLSAARITSPW
jgi:hypothetical protein